MENIIWFNPPYNVQVKTNIGKGFFHLLKKHFPPEHRLHKICNKNVIKLSYSCTPNMATIISAHNKKLLHEPDRKPKALPCNCRNKTQCPMSSRCREKCIVYKASVECSGKTMDYFGLCETEFKARYYNHVQSFRHREKSKATELSKYIWACKDSGLNPTISWKIICKANPYHYGSRQCNLCLAEKYYILTANRSTTLNKRTELVNKCRHKNKYKLKQFKPIP